MDIGQIIAEILKAPFICLGWLIVGAIAGALANSIMKSNQPLIVDIIIGLIGAAIGGLLFSLLDIGRPNSGLGAVLGSIVVATIGAIILIGILRAIRGRPVA
jgi:uncharacterized membrane protein YeaQ/YmgE (transglycosylase-associated protein family)